MSTGSVITHMQLPDDAACGLLQTNDRGLILLVNQTFCDWVGFTKQELIGKRKLQELFSVGGRIFHQTHWIPLLQLQGSISEVKLEVIHKNSESIPMVLNARLHKRETGIVHDIAAFIARDRDKYERELVQSRKELQRMVAEANRLRSLGEQVVAMVSHDLRNPLAVIAMSARLLSRSDASETQQKAIEHITRAGARASTLIHDLLDLSQARLNDGIAVQRKPGDLHQSISETVDELQVAYPKRSIGHESTGQGTCSFDANRISQMLGNLVSNAVAYGSAESAITVSSAIDASHFTLSVHNHGNPIPESMLATVFDPLVRGKTTSDNSHGLGLGLFISTQIIKAHGGTLKVNSTEEAGTKFSAVMPTT